MDIQKILAELHAERQQVSEVILILERLADSMKRRKDLPTTLGLKSLSGKRNRTVSSDPRVKPTPDPKKPAVKAKAAGN
ncbi:MAG: hypothetical protein ABIR70_07825 [Bryobacteraceae bacterium]